MDLREHEAYSVYDSLWRDAQPAIARNEIAIDAHLSDREHDQRRGLTVVARLPIEVTRSISRFLEPLEESESGQYYTRPDEFHITVLALCTAVEDHQPCFRRVEAYRQAAQSALKNAGEFAVAFRGVTASKGVIMVQGFPRDGMLNALRDNLRAALRDAGLGQNLDERYRVRAAHVSVARFAAPLTAPRQTSDYLGANRKTNFGTAKVQSLEMVTNDWYMSRDNVTLLDTYPLSQQL